MLFLVVTEVLMLLCCIPRSFPIPSVSFVHLSCCYYVSVVVFPHVLPAYCFVPIVVVVILVVVEPELRLSVKTLLKYLETLARGTVRTKNRNRWNRSMHEP